MKINKLAYALPLGLTALFSSCDDIAPADRFTPLERPEVKKGVLVLEFSGQNCRNCPDGAAALHNAIQSFPGQVMVVSMQPSGTTYTYDTPPLGCGLTSEIAKKYYDEMNPTGFPTASINGSTLNYNYTEWGSLILDAIEEAPVASLELSTSYDAETRTVDIDWKSEFIEPYSGELFLAMWIVESDIIGPQLVGSKLVMDYSHQHVLRAAISEMWGDPVNDEHGHPLFSFEFEQWVNGSVSFTLQPEWVPENCSIVAAILTPAHKPLQAAEAHVVSK